MINLQTIDASNYRKVSALKVSNDQMGFVAPAMSILARAYAMRNQNARAYAVCDDDLIVGVLLVRDIDEAPPCYDLDQFLIDEKHQQKGFGMQALRQIIEMLSAERKYNCIELMVKMNASAAIKMYTAAGFIDTGYIDPEEPDAYNFRLTFQ